MGIHERLGSIAHVLGLKKREESVREGALNGESLENGEAEARLASDVWQSICASLMNDGITYEQAQLQLEESLSVNEVLTNVVQQSKFVAGDGFQTPIEKYFNLRKNEAVKDSKINLQEEMREILANLQKIASEIIK